jgi:hypothetical protein
MSVESDDVLTRHAGPVPVVTSRFASFPLPSSLRSHLLQATSASDMDPYTSVDGRSFQISPDQAAKIIMAALAEPASIPLACIDLLIHSYNAILQLWERMHQISMSRSRATLRRYRNVFRLSMQFLCSFRTTEQLGALKQMLEDNPCRCAQGPEALHRYVLPARHRSLTDKTCLLPDLIAVLGYFLMAPIHELGGLKKLYKTTGRKIWPVSMDDLLPEGIASLHNLVRWIPHMDAGTAEQADHVGRISNILMTMPSYLRAGFIKGPILVDWLHRTVTTWMLQPIDVLAEKMSAEIDSTAAVVQSARYLSDDEIFLWLSSSTRYTIQEMFVLFDRALAMLMQYPTHAASYRDVGRISGAYRTMLDYMILADQTKVEFKLLLSVTTMDQMRLHMHRTVPATKLSRSIYGSNWSQRCYGPGCIATYADRSKRFKRCGGCRTAVYYSAQCQAAAWRYPGAAHRELCGLYRAYGDFKVTDGMDINHLQKAVLAWVSSPGEHLEAAHANVTNLLATQFVRLRTYLSAVAMVHDLTVLAEQEIETIRTD